VVRPAQEEGLRVEKVPLVAPDLDPPGPKEGEQVPDRAVVLEVEGQEVALASKAALELRESLLDAPARELGLSWVGGCAWSKGGFGSRVSAEQQAEPGNVVGLPQDQVEPLGIEEAGRDA
jgi:hypothetical protein